MVVVVAGCSRPSPQADAQRQLAEYTQLTLTAQSHHAPLQAELAHVEADRGLPRQLDADRGIVAERNGFACPLADEIGTAFTPSQLKFTRDRTDTFFAESAATWNPLVLEQALQFRRTYDAPHRRVQQSLALPGAQLRLPLGAGLGQNAAFTDAALVSARFEAIDAADAISRRDAGAAMQAIQRALRIAELLADEPQVAARLVAAKIRRDTFGVVQRLVDSNLITRSHLAQLEQVVSRQLIAWPNDAEAWIGDRALALSIYEMIRDGQILSVLTEDELLEIRHGEGIDVFAAAVVKQIEQDETHYLRTMREVMQLCDRPYYERAARLVEIDRERKVLLQTPDYPIVADRLLLAGVSDSQRQQAADLALAKAWSMALAISCSASLPPPERNPLTGAPYLVDADAQRVRIADIDPQQPELEIVVPIASHETATTTQGATRY
jgi:hypothetical protein